MDVVKYAIISFRKSNALDMVSGEWLFEPYKYEIEPCYVLKENNILFHGISIKKYTCKILKNNSIIYVEDLVFNTFEEAENKKKQLMCLK